MKRFFFAVFLTVCLIAVQAIEYDYHLDEMVSNDDYMLCLADHADEVNDIDDAILEAVEATPNNEDKCQILANGLDKYRNLLVVSCQWELKAIDDVFAPVYWQNTQELGYHC